MDTNTLIHIITSAFTVLGGVLCYFLKREVSALEAKIQCVRDEVDSLHKAQSHIGSIVIKHGTRISVLDERVKNQIDTTTNVLERLDKKLDELDNKLDDVK